MEPRETRAGTWGATLGGVAFSADEVRGILKVASRFNGDPRQLAARAVFSDAEIQRLLFVRWLIETGRMDKQEGW